MRIRKKPYAKTELLSVDFYIDDPASLKGKWITKFADESKPISVELGCGKGGWIAKKAHATPDTNFIGFDIKDEMLVLGKRNIEKEYGDEEIGNVLITAYNIEQIADVISKDDHIKDIYINFCNPWPRHKHQKHRLTYTRQLETYRTFISNSSKLYFKTDDDDLFTDTVRYLENLHWNIEFISYDFAESAFENNIMTEHEKMFMEMGKKIKGLIATPDKEEE